MNVKIRRALVSALLIAVVPACSKDPVAPPEGGGPTPSLGIDELILITASALQDPDFSTGGQYTFELSSLPLVQNREFGDFEVRYTTSNSCDANVEVFNFAENDWGTLASTPGTPVCSPVVTNWSRTLSEQAFTAEEFLNAGDQMVIRSPSAPRVRALQLNPNYDPIALRPLEIYGSGMHFQGSTIWLAGPNLHRVTTSGGKLSDVTTTLAYHSGLAFDGELFWTVDRSGTRWGVFYGVTPQGAVAASFAGSDDFESNNGMVYARGLLWACQAGHYRLMGIDLEQSRDDNFIANTENIEFPFNEVGTAVAYDGTDFYVAAGANIIKLSPAGLELDSHPLTVEAIIDMAYDRGSLWILHTGPRGVLTGGQFLTKFRL